MIIWAKVWSGVGFWVVMGFILDWIIGSNKLKGGIRLVCLKFHKDQL